MQIPNLWISRGQPPIHPPTPTYPPSLPPEQGMSVNARVRVVEWGKKRKRRKKLVEMHSKMMHPPIYVHFTSLHTHVRAVCLRNCTFPTSVSLHTSHRWIIFLEHKFQILSNYHWGTGRYFCTTIRATVVFKSFPFPCKEHFLYIKAVSSCCNFHSCRFAVMEWEEHTNNTLPQKMWANLLAQKYTESIFWYLVKHLLAILT